MMPMKSLVLAALIAAAGAVQARACGEEDAELLAQGPAATQQAEEEVAAVVDAEVAPAVPSQTEVAAAPSAGGAKATN